MADSLLQSGRNQQILAGIVRTYVETGDENDSPRGQIYLMRNPMLHESVKSFEPCNVSANDAGDGNSAATPAA